MKIFTINDYQFPIFACFSLFFAMINYWVSLAFPKNKIFFTLAKILVLFGNFFFALPLFFRWIGDGYFPLSNLYESLIFLAWAISSIHLFVEFQTKSRLLGAISTPILFLLSGFSSFTLPLEMQKALPLVPSLQSNWLMMHVSMMMISYATLIIGSLLCILYLVFFNFLIPSSTSSATFSPLSTFSSANFSSQTEEIKGIQDPIEKKELTSLFASSTSSNSFNAFSLNALLETIDTWSYRIIGLGFPFLTIGIISGAVWANEAWGSYWSWDPKETWALITWLIFAIYLHSRLLKGWQGQKAAFLGSVGFFVIWICYLGVNFLGKGLHSYGWVL
jgi:cytochrome c-type biogenesis protein CcsB